MMPLLRRLFPIGPYTPRHVLDYDQRGAWAVDLCVTVAVKMER